MVAIENRHHESMKGPLRAAHEHQNKVLGFLGDAHLSRDAKKSKKGLMSNELQNIHL